MPLSTLMRRRYPVPHTSLQDRTIPTKIARLGDVRVRIERVVTPVLANIGLEAQHNYRYFFSYRVCTHHIEHAQTTHSTHLQAQQD